MYLCGCSVVKLCPTHCDPMDSSGSDPTPCPSPRPSRSLLRLELTSGIGVKGGK